MASKKSYPVVGGPLDGVSMTSDEFARGYGSPGDDYYAPAGRFADLADEYLAFNCGSNHSRARGGRVFDKAEGKWVKSTVPSMVWLHVSLFEGPSKTPEEVSRHVEEPQVARSGEEVRFELACARVDDETEAKVERTLARLGAGGQLARPEGEGLCFVFTLATDDRDAALVEVAVALVEAGVPPFLSLTCEPSAESVLMPLAPSGD